MMNLLMQLSLSVILGTLIGLERQWRQRMAGLRTNALVSLGATLFCILSIRTGNGADARISAYIVSGIGFLGAGVIMKDSVNVRGLNTAATLWCSAAIGSFCGMGNMTEAVIGTGFILICHLLLRPIGNKIDKYAFSAKYSKNGDLEYEIVIICKPKIENNIRILLINCIDKDKNLLLHSLNSIDEAEKDNVIIVAGILSQEKNDSYIEKIASRLTIEPDVSVVKWQLFDN